MNIRWTGNSFRGDPNYGQHLAMIENFGRSPAYIEGETRILSILGNAYGQPEHHRGPYPLVFLSPVEHLNRTVIEPQAYAQIHLASEFLDVIQDDSRALALVYSYHDQPGEYLRDPSGIFTLEITLWAARFGLNRFLRRPRYQFRTVLTGPMPNVHPISNERRDEKLFYGTE